MNKEDAIKIINSNIERLDLSRDTTIIKYEKQFRNWINFNPKKLGIEVVKVYGITGNQPDFVIKVGDVSLNVDIVVQSRRFTNKFHPKENIDLVFCCHVNHREDSDIPILRIPLQYVNSAEERRKSRRALGHGLKQIWVTEKTKSKLLNLGIFEKTMDGTIEVLINSYEKLKEKENE